MSGSYPAGRASNLSSIRSTELTNAIREVSQSVATDHAGPTCRMSIIAPAKLYRVNAQPSLAPLVGEPLAYGIGFDLQHPSAREPSRY